MQRQNFTGFFSEIILAITLGLITASRTSQKEYGAAVLADGKQRTPYPGFSRSRL